VNTKIEITFLAEGVITLVKDGDRVLLYGEDGSKFILRVVAGAKKSTHLGLIEFDNLIGKQFGDRISIGKTGKAFYILPPTYVDDIFSMKRKTQIIYPKDSSYIIMKLDVKPGSKVIDTGIGSGAMCAAIARLVGETGKVYAYERREEFLKLARANLTEWGLADRVEFFLKDISLGFDHSDVDALLLDVPDPENYIRQCWEALKGGGVLGVVCPTTNQVTAVLEKIYDLPFVDVEVWESLMRQYKPVPGRLRPVDRMVAHTTYMIFARRVNSKPSSYQLEIPSRPDNSKQNAEEV